MTSNASYVVKTALDNPASPTLVLDHQKTMYGGKRIAVDDEVFVFASENHGGTGLALRGIVTEARATARKPDLDRQTPRVSIVVRCTGRAKHRLSRDELKAFSGGPDGRPEAELHFKLYRQATDKIVGITNPTAAFLRSLF